MHALYAAEQLGELYPSVRLVNRTMFNEFTLLLDRPSRPVVRQLAERGILGGVSLERLYPGEESLSRGLLLAVTETSTRQDVDQLRAALKEILA
jgi:glycine dehydrogenase subunit 1